MLLLPSAWAADPEFVGTAAAGQQFTKPETHLAAELGGTFAGGNTRSYQLSASLDADHRWILPERPGLGLTRHIRY